MSFLLAFHMSHRLYYFIFCLLFIISHNTFHISLPPSYLFFSKDDLFHFPSFHHFPAFFFLSLTVAYVPHFFVISLHFSSSIPSSHPILDITTYFSLFPVSLTVLLLSFRHFSSYPLPLPFPSHCSPSHSLSSSRSPLLLPFRRLHSFPKTVPPLTFNSCLCFAFHDEVSLPLTWTSPLV